MNSDANLDFMFALHIIDECVQGEGKREGEGERQQLHHDKLTEGFDNCAFYWVNDSWRNDKSSRAAEMNVIKLTTLWQIELAKAESVRNVNKWNVWERLQCAA